MHPGALQTASEIFSLRKCRVFEHAIPLTQGENRGRYTNKELSIRYDDTGLEIRVQDTVMLRAFKASGLANYPRIDTEYGVFEIRRCNPTAEWRDLVREAYEQSQEQAF